MAILDQQGRPINPPAQPLITVVAPSNIGSLMAPWIGEIDPDPRHRARYANAHRDDARVLQLYRDTLRDERCQAALDQRLDAAVARPWEVRPGGKRSRDKKAADMLADQLAAIDFDAICRRLLHGVWYGYAVAEAIWVPQAGGVGIADITVRAPDRFCWDAAGALQLRTRAAPRGAPVPPAKFVVLTRPGEHADIPHGPGLARWCYWPVWFKRHGFKFWAVALERFGTPVPYGTYPAGKPEDRDKLLDLLVGLSHGTPTAMPEGQNVDILESARRAGGDYDAFVNLLDRTITTTILGQSSTTDQGPWRGTAEVQKDVRDETVAGDCRLLDAALNKSIARWVTHWNMPGAAVPQIHHDTEPEEDLTERARREAIVARTTGLRPTEAHVRDVYGGEWEPAPRPNRSAEPGNEPDDAALAAAGLEGDEIDRAVAIAMGGWDPLMEPMIEPILAAAEDATGLKDFREGLPELAGAMNTDALTQALQRRTFTAALSGAAGLTDDPDDGGFAAGDNGGN